MALKKIMCLILMVVLSVLCFASCNFGATQDPPAPEKTITKIEYVNGSMDTTINVGQTLDTSTLKIKVTYSDGSSEEVASNKLTLSRVDTGIAGTKKLTITYEGFKTEVSIVVAASSAPAKPTVTDITNVSGFPTSLSIGDSFSTSAISAKVWFSDGTTKNVGIADGLVVDSTVNPARKGTYYVTVSYDGYISAPVAVTVSATLTGIHLDEASIKTEYYQNDVVNLSGIKVYTVYSDGSRERITDTSALVIDTAAITTDTLGERSFTITYTADGQDFDITVPYTVVKKPIAIEIDESSVNTTVILGGTVDTSAIAVEVVYSDNSREAVDVSELQIGNVNTAIAGEKTLTVRYGDLTDTITIKVESKLIGIEYKGAALQFIHVAGNDNDPENTAERLASYVADGVIVIDLVYDNGTGSDNYTRIEKAIESIDEIEHSALNTSVVTDEAFMNIAYAGFSASVEYSVIKYLDSIVVSEDSTFVPSIGHHDDAESALAGLVMTAVYSNGDTEDITVDNLTVDGLATDTIVAAAEMTVSYENEFGAASATVAYEIYKKVVALEFADESYPLVYKPGDTVSTATEVNALIVYSDGTSNSVVATLDDFALDTFITEGTQKELTFFYVDENEQTLTGSVTVEVLAVKSIQVSGLDTYVPYWNTEDEIPDGYVDSLIGKSNISVLVTFEARNGETSTETLTAGDVHLTHNIDIKNQGTYSATVITDVYGETEVDITVGIQLSEIAVNGATNKYFQGGELSLSNITITATYHDGSTKDFAYSEIKAFVVAEGFTTENVGENLTYTVTYTENEVSVSTTVEYSVYPAFDEETTEFRFNIPSKEITVGEAFDYKLYGTFKVNGVDVTGEEDFIVDCRYDTSNIMTSLAGNYTVKVSYQGLTAEMTLRVVNEIVDGDGDNVTDKAA